METKSLKRKRQPENENIQILFKQLRNRINREISKAKIKYYTQYFDEYKNNTKKIWEGIRKIVKVSLKTSQLHIDGKIIDDDKGKLLMLTSLMSFNTGVYPDLLKIVKTIPIHKGGSTQEVNNFRPISLL